MNSVKKLPIYFISLEKSSERREQLKKQFPKNYDSFVWIKGVDGQKVSAKEYFDKTLSAYPTYQHPITPSEYGCTASHVKALKSFLAGGEKYALILEDDVIGDDADLERAITLGNMITQLKNYPSNAIYQLALPSYPHRHWENNVFLKPYNPALNLYLIYPSSIIHFYHAVSYIVTRKSAQIMLTAQNESFIYADDWLGYAGNNQNIVMLYSKIFTHPPDLTHSTLEADRTEMRKVLTEAPIGFRNLLSTLKLTDPSSVAYFIKHFRIKTVNKIKQFIRRFIVSHYARMKGFKAYSSLIKESN